MEQKEYKRRGPKPKYGVRREIHLKVSPEVFDYVEKYSIQGGVQAYLEGLIKADMRAHGESVNEEKDGGRDE